MKFTPNINNKTRALYASIGLVFILGSYLAGLGGWIRVTAVVLGLALVVGGASGL